MEVEYVALTAHRAAHPELGERIDKIQEYLNNKLYKQLTDLLIDFTAQPCFAQGTELVALFEETIAGLETKVNPLRFVQLLVACARQKSTLEEKIAFVEPFKEKEVVTKDTDAKLFWTTAKAAWTAPLEGKQKEAKELLEEVEKTLDESLGLETLVRSFFHQTAASYYKIVADDRQYYRSLLLYLSYTKVEDIPEKERMQVAFDVAVALLVADKEFDFGELLQQDLMVLLKNEGPGDKKWIVDLLNAFCEGKFDLYDAAMKSHGAKLKACPELKTKEEQLKKKMTQLSLMEMVFQRPKKERRVQFPDIAQHCRVEPKQVEFLLMRAMNEKLVSGIIDEVEQVVDFTWVKPRILDTARIEVLRGRIDAWGVQTKTLMSSLEDMTPELMVSAA